LAPEGFLLERLDCIVDVNELQSEEHNNFAPGGPEITELFFKSYLVEALENEKFQLATALIERGADVNYIPKNGVSILLLCKHKYEVDASP
jgi:hypothetical protein